MDKNKKIVFCLIVFLFTVYGKISYLFANNCPDETFTFTSQNGKYILEAKVIDSEVTDSYEYILKYGEKTIWSNRKILGFLQQCSISDNGEAIVLTLAENRWRGEGEGISKSLAFYNKAGELLKQIDLDYGYCMVEATAISSDGLYYVLSTHYYIPNPAVSGNLSFTASTEKIKLYLYDCKTGSLIWLKEYEFSENRVNVEEIEISNKGKEILLATSNEYGTGDVVFTLLNREGNILWQKETKKNYPQGIDHYLFLDDNGEKFTIVNCANEKNIFYITYLIKEGKVIEVTDDMRRKAIKADEVVEFKLDESFHTVIYELTSVSNESILMKIVYRYNFWLADSKETYPEPKIEHVDFYLRDSKEDGDYIYYLKTEQNQELKIFFTYKNGQLISDQLDVTNYPKIINKNFTNCTVVSKNGYKINIIFHWQNEEWENGEIYSIDIFPQVNPFNDIIFKRYVVQD